MRRSHARELAVHLSFALSFSNIKAEELLQESVSRGRFEALKDEVALYEEFPNEKQRAYISQLVSGVGTHGPELDSYISKYAVDWSFSRISRMAATIMRVAMYEILYMPDVPPSAAINDGVNIAKNYENAETVSFINGILGSFMRGELPPERVSQRTRYNHGSLPGAGYQQLHHLSCPF